MLIPILNPVVPHRMLAPNTPGASPILRSSLERETDFTTFASTIQKGPPNAVSLSLSNSDTQNWENLRVLLRNNWSSLLGCAWLGGAFIFGLRLVTGFWQLRRLGRESSPLNAERLLLTSREVKDDLSIRFPVQVRVADQQCKIVVPLTWGWRKPVVLLPYDAEQWSAPKLRAVLLHEQGHIARGDWGFLLLAQLACVLYWFHPLVWVASRQLRAEIERATDDQVLATGMRPSEYVTYLMEFTNAAKLRMKSQSIGILKIERVSIGMTQASTFKSRLEALLEPDRNRQRPSRAQLVGFLGATSLTLLTLAHFSDADAAPDSPYPLAKNVRVFGQVLDSGR
ncbi:MAG: M56 family metallopeptidase, partial [Proteobacteria bacterium]